MISSSTSSSTPAAKRSTCRKISNGSLSVYVVVVIRFVSPKCANLCFVVQKNNAHIVKRVPEGPIFSKEPGNLRNLHSFKWSGIANTKTIDIKDTGAGIQITTTKKNATPQAVRAGKSTSSIRNRSGGRRSYGQVAQLAKRGYRPDLRQAAVARVSALLLTQKEKKAAPPRKVRGKKATDFA
ncbi:hypothetical protein EUX98_g3952 [Antrodiella citrinella]|uniref:Ribosomal eL28/Mak16 domain-containing protein n=1 Tax=Antrodiella citrinella TaxID=2447956 RepID=A0A4S4MV58_9APHY|nr:hypothetical protein EUX98_g3952 [Antrodiella citrinella]